MSDLDERAWWAIATPMGATWYVPATSEAAARQALAVTVDKAYRDAVQVWPLVSTRVTSRERLAASLMRAPDCRLAAVLGEAR